VAEVSWAFADNALWLIATSLVMSATGGAIFGPGTVILARLVPDALRQQSFGTNFMLLNAGIAIGGLVSAAVVNLHKPSTFVALYLGTAAFSFLGIFPMLRLRSLGGPVSDKELSEEQTREGWREVLRDRRLIHLIVAAVVLLTCGYGSLDAGFSLYVVDQYHLPIRLISVTLVFNTVAIVFTQLYVLRRIHGKSRTRVMALVSAFWATCWLIVGLATHTSHWVAIISLCVAQVIFALGETLWSPMGPSLVNHIAPEHLRGRYNAAFGVTWGLASIFAPLIAGVFLGSSSAGLWPYVLCVGALAGGVTMLRLRRRLSAEEDGLVVAR
jgi:MFS family permease